MADATGRLVKLDGVLTEGDADTAREALRQILADPHGLEQGWAVQPYTDHGRLRYVFRCWGTDGGCEGVVSLDHRTRTSAESARDRHFAEAHSTAEQQHTEPWTLDHQLAVLPQIESRPGPPDEHGTRWVERRRTGKVLAACSCGYSTGLIDRADLPPMSELAAQHPATRDGA